MPKYRIKQGQKHYARDYSQPLKRGGVKLFVGGDIIEMTESQAKVFIDKLDPLGPTLEEKLAEKEVEKTAEDTALRIVPAEHGFFNVLQGTTGRPINSKPLTREEAEQVVGFSEDET